MDEPQPTSPRARATLVLEPSTVVWPDVPRGLARLECLGDAALVEVDPQCAGGGPVVHVVPLDAAPPEHAVAQWVPSLPGGQEPLVTLEPGARREHAVGPGRPLVLPGPGRYAVHVEYAWRDGSARSEPVEVHVSPASLEALACHGRSGGTQSPSLCLLGERGPTGVQLRLATLDHDGPLALGPVVALGPVPRGAAVALSVPPQALPTRQHVAYVDGSTLHAFVHAHGHVTRQAQALPAPGFHVLGSPVEDAYEDGRLPGCEALLARDDAAGWALGVVALDGSRALPGPTSSGARPSLACTAAAPDGERITLAFGAGAGRPDGPHAHGYAIRWARGRGVHAVERLGERPGVALALDLVITRDRHAVGAALVRAPDRARVEVHVLGLDPSHARAASGSRTYVVEGEVEHAAVRLDAGGRPHVVLATHDGRLHGFGPGGEHRVLDLAPGTAGPPYALVLAGDRTPVLLYGAPGVGLRMHALGPLPRARGPA